MLALLWLGCATTPTPAEQISPLVHDWFALLESRTADPSDFERFLASPAFELTGSDGQRLGIPELSGRLRELRSSYVSIDHRIDDLRVEPDGPSLYRARFRVERHAVDVEGTPHLARTQVSWLVRAEADAAPVVLQIDEQPLLPYPGSGPRIVCY